LTKSCTLTFWVAAGIPLRRWFDTSRGRYLAEAALSASTGYAACHSPSCTLSPCSLSGGHITHRDWNRRRLICSYVRADRLLSPLLCASYVSHLTHAAVSIRLHRCIVRPARAAMVAAHHRNHHQNTDTECDPHSPRMQEGAMDRARQGFGSSAGEYSGLPAPRLSVPPTARNG
jgi:hypothetical protein